MGQAIGGSLPLAIGVAVSPVPTIGLVLMLTTRRAHLNGPAFILGWLAGLGVVGAIVLAIADPTARSTAGGPATWVSWLKIVLGGLLLLVAVRNFQRRPRGDAEPELPGWMARIDRVGLGAALGLGAGLAGANPKNLLLAVAAAAAIAQTGILIGQQAIAYATFAVIGSLGVVAPVAVYFAMGQQRSQGVLAGLKDWMASHNAVIMSVLCLIISAKLIGDAPIGGLAG
jgi:hypothetical protein